MTSCSALYHKNKNLVHTLRSCGPNRSALPPPASALPGRRAGWPLAAQHQGWQHQGWLAVCRVCQHTASTASTSTASQHTPRVSCVPLWPDGTHGTHLRPCVSCGHVCHHFQIEVAPQTWKSYTIHTVIIYSIYITIKSSRYMTHLTHTRGFSEGQITPAPMPTTSPTPTHTH